MRHLYHSSSAAFRSYDIWFENCLGMHMVDWKHKGRVICIKRVVSPKGWMDGTWYTFSTFPSVIGICPLPFLLILPHSPLSLFLELKPQFNSIQFQIQLSMAVGNIYVIATIAIIGGGLFGFDISSMSAIIGTSQYKCYFNQGSTQDGCTGPKASVQGGITASMAGGSWLAALISGFLSDKLGRKKTIMVGSVIWCV